MREKRQHRSLMARSALLNPEGSEIRSRGLNGVLSLSKDEMIPPVSDVLRTHPGWGARGRFFIRHPARSQISGLGYLEYATALARLRRALLFHAMSGGIASLNPRLRISEPSGFMRCPVNHSLKTAKNLLILFPPEPCQRTGPSSGRDGPVLKHGILSKVFLATLHLK